MDNTEPLVVPYYMDCVARGYYYECTCGEVHRTEKSAWDCRKCSVYLPDDEYTDRKVIDIRTLDGLR